MAWQNMNSVIEPVPIDDVFITGLCRIEDLGSGVIRYWAYADEGQQRVIKAKLVLPLVCAAVMNLQGMEIFTRMVRNYPAIVHLARH